MYNSTNKIRKRWLIFSVSGLILIGLGFSVTLEAAFLKHGQAATWDWVLLGTAGLVIFNSGISLFGQGVVERVKMLKGE